MMATYGMGSAEVRTLRLDDVDWTARTIRVRRPKTGSITILPSSTQWLGLSCGTFATSARCMRATGPSSSAETFRTTARAKALLHRLRKHAERADVRGPLLGTHVFRHTHATHQIDAGVPAKLVGDILGHRDPSSTSTYVRSAIVGLRGLALPVPR